MTDFIPEFSRLVGVDRIPAAGMEQRLEAKPAERAALAKRFDLLELPLLKAALTLTPGAQHTIKVTGKIEADLAQSCVVTLDPVGSHLKIPVDVTFIPAATYGKGAGSPDPGDVDEEFEVFAGGKIDLGELVAQHLGVNLNPYPRKAGVALGSVEFGPKIEQAQPLAQLVTLAKKTKKPGKADN